MAKRSRRINPWIKGYDIAISYSRSQFEYVKALHVLLAQEFGEKNIFFCEDEKTEVRLSGAVLGRALALIYRKSKIVIVILGEDYEERKWPYFEAGYILNKIAEDDTDYYIMLFRDAGLSKENIPEEFKGLVCPKKEGKEYLIVEYCIERLRGFNKQSQKATEGEGELNPAITNLIDRHVPLSKYYFDNEEIECNANGKTVEGTCMAAEVSKSLAAAIAVKQKIARISRVMHHLRDIEHLLPEVDLYKQKGQTQKIMLRQCMINKCYQLLDEFLRHKVCNEDGSYYDEVKQPVSEAKAEIKEKTKEGQRLVLESKLVQRLRGFLEHHANDEHAAVNFLDLISYFLNIEKSEEIPDNLWLYMSEFCIESNKIADIMWEQSGIPNRIEVGKWSKEYFAASSGSIDQHRRIFVEKLAQYPQFLLENVRLERIRRY